MNKTITLLTALMTGTIVAGCSSTPSSPIATGALPSASGIAAKPGSAAAKFAKPVKVAHPTRMYVWAGFKEKDCSPVKADMAVALSPAKGAVSFQPNETITIQHSASGKCIGKRMPGTAVYYTPKIGQDGADSFTVTAKTASGQVVTRSFNVNIVQ